MNSNYSEDVEMLDVQEEEEEEEVGAELDPECKHPFRSTLHGQYLSLYPSGSQ